ncbi:MAG: hypothetical protein HY670_01200 [Chloroflexi bacterium]|nr:hypothetical protein [Chloroflexota bacterium]
MCQRCGCQQFIEAGREAVLKRAVEIVAELKLSPSNVDDYEITETISGIIAPFGLREDEVFRIASWISGLHDDHPLVRRGEQYQKHMRAFQDSFARLPVPGDPKYIATTYHQLEQLARRLDEAALASLPFETQKTIEAVNHVHEDKTRLSRVKERYGL